MADIVHDYTKKGLFYYILDYRCMLIFCLFWGAFPFLLIISWGSPPPNSGDPNVSPLAKVGAGWQKTQDTLGEEVGEGGFWPTGELKIQNLGGRPEVGGGGKDAQSECLCASVCMSECLFASLCMSVQRESMFVSVWMSVQRVHICFSLSVTAGVSVCITVCVSSGIVHVCFSLIVSSERVHVCFSLRARV